MTYNKRIPPLKVELTTNRFNCLIEFLEKIEEEEKKETAIKLKEKLLKYSIPVMTESDTLVAIRFFNQEIIQLSYLLIDNAINNDWNTNYYEILIENRKRVKEMI